MTTAIYPGTFDPLTNGHADIVERGSRLFDTVVVAVASSAGKVPTFTLEERVEFARTTLGELENVEVRPFDGLLVEFARTCNALVLLRGVRAVADFELELQFAGMNRRLAPEIETVLLPTTETWSCLSSSLVREIAQLGGDVTDFVHPVVVDAFKAKG